MDDPFGPEDKTAVTHGIPTPARGIPMPDFERGFADGAKKGLERGERRGITKMSAALRFCLLRVGVPPEEVEGIVLKVQGWMVSAPPDDPSSTSARREPRGAGQSP